MDYCLFILWKIYNFADCKFNLSKLDMTDITYKRVVQDDTYMPCVDMED